jgi:hypothetical protein
MERQFSTDPEDLANAAPETDKPLTSRLRFMGAALNKNRIPGQIPVKARSRRMNIYDEERIS